MEKQGPTCAGVRGKVKKAFEKRESAIPAPRQVGKSWINTYFIIIPLNSAIKTVNAEWPNG